MISKFLIWVVQDRKLYLMDCETCEENPSRLKNFMTRNILWRKRLYLSRRHSRSLVCLDLLSHHQRVLTLHQWRRVLKKRRKRRNGWAGLVVEVCLGGGLFFLLLPERGPRTLLLIVYNKLWKKGGWCWCNVKYITQLEDELIYIVWAFSVS